MLTPLALRVISRIRRLNRSRDFGAIVRLKSGPAEKLNPRNFRSCGRATALLASFTLSLSFWVMKREMLSMVVADRTARNSAPEMRESYICIKNLSDGHRAIGEAVIILTSSLSQFRFRQN
jgi:hypothetical protein